MKNNSHSHNKLLKIKFLNKNRKNKNNIILPIILKYSFFVKFLFKALTNIEASLMCKALIASNAHKPTKFVYEAVVVQIMVITAPTRCFYGIESKILSCQSMTDLNK